MKKLRITLLAFCILGSLAIQAQNRYWAMSPLKKFDTANPNQHISNLPGVPNTCSAANITPGTQGLFDANGTPVFYVHHDQIYDKNGQVRGTIPGVGLGNRAFYCIQGLHIVPVPNGRCGEYYVIYARQFIVGTGNSPNAYEVGALRVTVDANQNISVSNTRHSLTYPNGGTLHAGIGTALSREFTTSPNNNKERMLYVNFRSDGARPGQPENDQVVKIRVTNTGLARDGGFGVFPSSTTVWGHSLELSPNQRYLAWIQNLGGFHIMVVDLQNNTTQAIRMLGFTLGIKSEIEFGTNSNDIYVTTGQGIVKTSLSNPQSVSFILGTSATHYEGQLEMDSNDKLYATARNNQLYVIDLNRTTLQAQSIEPYASLSLPEQVDGENIFYDPSPLGVTFSILITGHTQANVTGGSGSYTYTWTDLSGINPPQNGNPVLLCGRGRGLYTLTVEDNVSGCSTTTPPFNTAPCTRGRSTGNDIEISDNRVKAYPNPTTDYLNVQVRNEEKIVQLQVVDLQGKVLNQWDGQQKATQRIDTNDLKRGGYLLIVITDKFRHQMKFFVK